MSAPIMYSFQDTEFQNKLREFLKSPNLLEGRMHNGGRTIPGALSEIHETTGKHVVFLSNDSRYSGSDGFHRGMFGYSYARWIEFGDGAWTWEGNFEDQLVLKDGAKFMAVDSKGRAGSFLSKEEIAEYLGKNPASELRFFEISNELKPSIEVKFA